jgi:hypothetical protein
MSTADEQTADRIGPSGYRQAELNAARLEAAALGYGLKLRPARARKRGSHRVSA